MLDGLRRFLLKIFVRDEDKILADLWDNKFKKSEIYYNARGTYKMDVRNLVVPRSNVLSPVANKLSGSYDNKAIEALKYVRANFTYKYDSNNYNEVEYWQHPEISLQKGSGDCEDGALLIASILRNAGVPAYRLKVCAGWVKTANGKQGGHAYVIYLADDNCWYILDWCYYGNESEENFLKVQHKENIKYQEIWWTFNDQYSWAQHTTELGKK